MSPLVELMMANFNGSSTANSTTVDGSPDFQSVLEDSAIGSLGRVLSDLERTAGLSVTELSQVIEEHRRSFSADRRKLAIMRFLIIVSFLVLLGSVSLNAVIIAKMELSFKDGDCKISANLASKLLVLPTPSQTAESAVTTEATGVAIDSTLSDGLLVFKNQEPNWF